MEASPKIGRWEALGAVWIVAVGTPLHFLYSSTGWSALAWLAPVNESTWEHCKLAFWPGLAWAGFEYFNLPEQRRFLWTAKLVGLGSMPVLIASIFYGYTALLGRHMLALDIATFILAAAGGQWLGYVAWARAWQWRPAPWLLATLAALFVAFSFRPPPMFLFDDPQKAGCEGNKPPTALRFSPDQISERR